MQLITINLNFFTYQLVKHLNIWEPIGVTLANRFWFFAEIHAPIPPFWGAILLYTTYIQGLINSFGGNSIALVSRTQVGSLDPQKNCPCIFI